MIAAEEAVQAFGYLESRVAFFGHTHVQGGFIWNHSRVETVPRTSLRSDRQVMEIDADCAYLINPGSVGQPRDNDPRAAYALYDSDAQMVTYYRVPYDVATAQREDPSLRAAARSGGPAGDRPVVRARAFGAWAGQEAYPTRPERTSSASGSGSRPMKRR